MHGRDDWNKEDWKAMKREFKREWQNAKHGMHNGWQGMNNGWHGMRPPMRPPMMHHHGMHHHGMHHSMHHNGWWMWGGLFIGLMFLMGAFKAGWWIWFMIPFVFWFVIPKMRMMSREWNRGGWGDWNGSPEDAEKRKNSDPAYDVDDKPKNSPTYYVGDDGELVDPRESRKNKRDDIEYI